MAMGGGHLLQHWNPSGDHTLKEWVSLPQQLLTANKTPLHRCWSFSWLDIMMVICRQPQQLWSFECESLALFGRWHLAAFFPILWLWHLRLKKNRYWMILTDYQVGCIFCKYGWETEWTLWLSCAILFKASGKSCFSFLLKPFLCRPFCYHL